MVREGGSNLLKHFEKNTHESWIVKFFIVVYKLERKSLKLIRENNIINNND